MIIRKLKQDLFSKSTFLLGPRQVGKSTYLTNTFPESIYIDLLDNDLYFQYMDRPGKFRESLQYQLNQNPKLKELPIIIDDIQRVPILLNEVHHLIETESLHFILCGSSARKLVRGGANMLGGRAGRIEMGGLAIAEIQNYKLLRHINHGGLPVHYLSDDPSASIKAYVQNYLQEEIKGEALVRNLRSFHRFLELVGITHSQEVNYKNMSRDVGVDAKTVKEYFQILIDTLIGRYLEPFFDKQKRSNILKSPKFYLFDTGIVAYLKGVSLQKEHGSEFGQAFEHIIYNELLCYKNYQGLDVPISYWRTYEQDEVDFILGEAEVAIEVKSTTNVKKRDLKGLLKFNQLYQPQKSIVVSCEPTPRRLDSGIDIIPYREFVRLLWGGGII